MALWQFTTIAALIGVLLIYLMVLTNRIGATNALLKRIEEALVKPQPLTENIRAARVRPTVGASTSGAVAAADRTFATPSAEPAAESEAREMADASDAPTRDRRVSFLTVRDLKVIARSGRRSSDSTLGMSPLFHEAMERRRAGARSRAEGGQTHEEQISGVVAGEVNVAGVVSDGEFATTGANECAEVVAPINAANEQATIVAPTVVTSIPADTSATADAPSVTSAANNEADTEADPASLAANDVQAIDNCLVTPVFAANKEVRGETGSAALASNDESLVDPRLVRATFAPDDEPVPDAPAAIIAANELPAGAEAEPLTATADEQPAAQPVDEALLERRRKRDAQLILSAQRRRRRTRGF